MISIRIQTHLRTPRMAAHVRIIECNSKQSVWKSSMRDEWSLSSRLISIYFQVETVNETASRVIEVTPGGTPDLSSAGSPRQRIFRYVRGVTCAVSNWNFYFKNSGLHSDMRASLRVSSHLKIFVYSSRASLKVLVYERRINKGLN